MTTLQAPEQLPRVQKPRSIRKICSVDIAEVKTRVLRLSDKLWDIENERKANKFFCFHHTRHIVFRFIQGNRDPRVFESYPVWDVWSPLLEPLFRTVIEGYGFQDPVFPKAMLARLAAGHVIDRHVDGAGSNLCTHKIHIPITTNPAALFTSNDETHHLEVGGAYEANNVAPHSVENRGKEDRIHLIFEVFDAAA